MMPFLLRKMLFDAQKEKKKRLISNQRRFKDERMARERKKEFLIRFTNSSLQFPLQDGWRIKKICCVIFAFFLNADAMHTSVHPAKHTQLNYLNDVSHFKFNREPRDTRSFIRLFVPEIKS